MRPWRARPLFWIPFAGDPMVVTIEAMWVAWARGLVKLLRFLLRSEVTTIPVETGRCGRSISAGLLHLDVPTYGWRHVTTPSTRVRQSAPKPTRILGSPWTMYRGALFACALRGNGLSLHEAAGAYSSEGASLTKILGKSRYLYTPETKNRRSHWN